MVPPRVGGRIQAVARRLPVLMEIAIVLAIAGLWLLFQLVIGPRLGVPT